MLQSRFWYILLLTSGLATGAYAQNPNILLNPGFESGTSPWSFHTNGTGTFASASPGFTGARTGRVTITTTGSNMQLYQSGIALEPGTKYTLSFTAYSSRGRDLSVSLLKQTAPFTAYGLSSRLFNLTTGWQSFTVQFTTTGFSATVSDGRLRFWFASLAAAGEVYFIDDVQLRKTVVTPAPPAITQEPLNRTVTEGSTATFIVAASGAAPLSYQWLRNGTPLGGANGASYTTPAAVKADSGTAFRCIATNALGADTSRTAYLLVSAPLSITIWQGRQQRFGHVGDPTPAINILGNVFAANGLASLTYSLNGRPEVTLSRGPDLQRLQDRGDFNADIPIATLLNGTNRIVLRARDSINQSLLDTVLVTYAAGNTWPLPYSIDWRTAGRIENVAQVLDGLWAIDAGAGTLRTLQLGYDRLVAIGEQTWRDYEITVPVTIHGIDSSGFAPPSNGAGIGFILRWPGHSDLPVSVAGRQPKTGYLPLGAIAWYRYSPTAERLVITGNNLQTLAQETNGRRLVHGVRYVFKARVESVPGVGGRYGIKIWQAGLPEPAAWDLTGQEELTDPQQGSAVLIAHHVDVSFGAVTVTPLSSASSTLTVGVTGSGTVSRVPDQPAYSPGQLVTLTATANAGWQFQSWSGDLTGSANPATIAMNGNRTITATFTNTAPQTTLVSDEFNAPALNTALWTFVNPRADAALTMTGTQLSIAVPAGSAHDVWRTGNAAPRVMQRANNADFEIETRFQSSMTARYQIQGLIVAQDSLNFIRFDFVRDSARTRAFAATFTGGVPTTRKDTTIAGGNPLYLRVRRQGAAWTQRFSVNGSSWTTAATFSHPLVVNNAGPFFGNAGNPAPAFAGFIDYFRMIVSGTTQDEPSARTTPGSGSPGAPEEFSLGANYPNPFNGETRIGYGVRGAGGRGWVRLSVFDVLGREVARLIDGPVEPGMHSVRFDATDLPSGVYFYRMQVAGSSGESFTGTGRMILIR